MKKLLSAVAVAGALAAGSANAGFYCKLEGYNSGLANTGASSATSKTLEWHWGQAFPDTTPFDYRNKDVVCFVDGGILYEVVPLIGGLKKVLTLSSGLTQGPGSGPQVGVAYRGDDARFLIDNLRSVPYTSGGAPNSGNPGIRLADFIANIQP